MVIGAHMRRVAKVNLRLFAVRQGFDLRIFFFQPLFHQRLVPLQRLVQRLLAGEPQLRQQAPNRGSTQFDLIFVFDQLGDHLARP